jgi:hypothetical protein
MRPIIYYIDYYNTTNIYTIIYKHNPIHPKNIEFIDLLSLLFITIVKNP